MVVEVGVGGDNETTAWGLLMRFESRALASIM